jgi:hypothetical protein
MRKVVSVVVSCEASVPAFSTFTSVARVSPVLHRRMAAIAIAKNLFIVNIWLVVLSKFLAKVHHFAETTIVYNQKI